MLEERRIYLEEQEDYANGFYTRDLLFVSSYFLKEGGLKSISRLIKVTEDEVKSWRERALSEEYLAIFLDGTYLSIRQK